jgi:hypothetical protein
VPQPQTNIVAIEILRHALSPEALCRQLAQRGVLAIPFGPRRIRMVVYGAIGDAVVDGVVEACAQCLGAAAS